jgi:DNA topoisomerase-1
VLGVHPDDKEPVIASQGRFGPYVKHGDEFRSLEEGDNVLTIELPRALELLAAPKRSRRRQAAAKTVLRELGPHPRTQAVMRLLAGRYGPYVTDGTTNASLPKGMSPDAVTIEEAADLIDARAAAGPAKGKSKRAAPRRTATKKPRTAEPVGA